MIVCFAAVLVELKAIRETTKVDEAQVLNYFESKPACTSACSSMATKVNTKKFVWI